MTQALLIPDRKPHKRARKFKVMELPGDFKTPPGSHIRFRGQWLKDHGFTPGSQFTVETPSPGLIVLRLITDPCAPDPDYLSAIARLDAANPLSKE